MEVRPGIFFKLEDNRLFVIHHIIDILVCPTTIYCLELKEDNGGVKERAVAYNEKEIKALNIKYTFSDIEYDKLDKNTGEYLDSYSGVFIGAQLEY